MRGLTPFLIVILGLVAGTLPAAELKIVCSVPDLADLVQRIGGERVDAQGIARPRDNAHFVQVRPSTVHALSRADALVVVGMDLEIGWVPALIRGARNNAIRPGAPGYIDCSAAIDAMEVPTGTLDRSMGDVHPHGNPHYLLSPACTIQVIDLLGERLALLDEADAAGHRQRAAALAREFAGDLYGEAAAQAHDPQQLVAWHLAGELDAKLGDVAVGGWVAAFAPAAGAALIDDHSQWPYLAKCLGFTIVGHLEPKAGVPPSAKHLQQLAATARDEDARGIITAPWFDPRHARTLSEATGLPVVPLAHQVGALPGTGSVRELHAANVAALRELLLDEAP